MKLELLKRLDNSKEGGAEGARLVEQQDPQLDGGDNAAQPGKELVGQQLHQHNHGGGAAAPKKRGRENLIEEEKPVWYRGGDQKQESSLKPSDILKKQRSSKRKWCDNNMEGTGARPKSRAKTTSTTRSGTETTPKISQWLKETTKTLSTQLCSLKHFLNTLTAVNQAACNTENLRNNQAPNMNFLSKLFQKCKKS